MQQVAFSSNGQRLASAGLDAGLWEVKSGKLLHTLQSLDPLGKPKSRDYQYGGVLSLQFSGDGRRLLVATKEAGARITTRTLFGFGKNIEEEVPYTPVRLWDVETGKQLLDFQGARGQVGRAAFSPNGKLVLAAEDGRKDIHFLSSTGQQTGNSSEAISDGQAYIWDAVTGKLVQTLTGRQGQKDHLQMERQGGPRCRGRRSADWTRGQHYPRRLQP